MSQDETDPGASTDRFHAFVEGEEAGRAKARWRPSTAAGVVALLLLVVLAVALWLLL